MPAKQQLTLQQQLFDPEEACSFEPFQAVRLLELIANSKPDFQWDDLFTDANTSSDISQLENLEGHLSSRPEWKSFERVIRFRSNLTLAFPPSLISQIIPPQPDDYQSVDPLKVVVEKMSASAKKIRDRYLPRKEIQTAGKLSPGYNWRRQPNLVGNFLGLFGPNGALPIPYTRKLLELDSEARYRQTSTRSAFRDWLDIFNHRLMQLLFQGWEKYRFSVSYTRNVWRVRPNDFFPDTDRFSQVLFSAIGLGTKPLRNRLAIYAPDHLQNPEAKPLARIEDRALLKYVSVFARQRAGVYELEGILEDYFCIAISVQSMTGQWLALPESVQTKLTDDGNAALGVNCVAGEKVWDASSMFRLILGPMSYKQFVSYLPDPHPSPARKGVYLLSQLTRLYVGAELDFEIQLILKKEEVPPPELRDAPETELGTRLGWNLWLCSEDGLERDADDLIFDAPCESILPKL